MRRPAIGGMMHLVVRAIEKDPHDRSSRRDPQHEGPDAEGRPDRGPQQLRAEEEDGGGGYPFQGGRYLQRLHSSPPGRGGGYRRLRRRRKDDRGLPRGPLPGRAEHANRAGDVPHGSGAPGRPGAGDHPREVEGGGYRGAQPLRHHPKGLPREARVLEEGPEAAEALLERFGAKPSETPVTVWQGEEVLKNPTNAEFARTTGLAIYAPRDRTYDLVVVGTGPAGLGAAVYG